MLAQLSQVPVLLDVAIMGGLTPSTGDVVTTARQRTPTLEVRGALLRAARELLDRSGPAALSVRDIAAAAGVAPMGVYKRFGSKNGILDALLEQGFTELAAAVDPTHRDVVPTDTDPSSAAAPPSVVAAGMHRYRRFALTNPALYALMFDRPVPDLEPSAAAMAAARTAFNHLVTAVQLGIATGDFHPGDPTEIAQRLWAGCHGAVSLELRGISFITDSATHYTALITTLLRGIAGKGTQPP